MSSDALVTPSGIVIPSAAITTRFSRSGGPGGQHANTSDTKVELVCDLSAADLSPALQRRLESRLGPVVRVTVSTHRSQAMNRSEALQRLAVRLDAAARPVKVRRPTKRTRRSEERRLARKRHRARRKELRRRPARDDD